MAKNKIYRSLDSLTPVIKVVEEAGKAVKDKGRTIKTSDIPEILGAVAGVGVGGAVGYGLLGALGYAGLSGPGITAGLATAGKIVGGGMVAGIGVLTAPAIVLGVGGYAALSRRKRKKLEQTKESLLQEAIAKHDAILQELNNELNLSKERMEYLNRLNIILQAAINDLEEDLSA